ncbi:alkaline phosphatase family protein [Geminocystis sp.]|uniref:alkaline phosphatase family protein n=1 Tax=Geminocystis sp. TaxID=2664100 RepID=UPI0035937E40
MVTKSQHPLIVIGIDAVQPSLLEEWMSKGFLPHISSLLDRGSYGHLENFRDSNVETAWTTVATGCAPQTTGFWGMMGLKEDTYETETRGAYNFQEYPAFFSHLKDYRIATFDVPQLRISPDINGIQMGGWGAHSPQVPSSSVPESFFNEIISKHGNHPGLHDDYAACLDLEQTLAIEKRLLTGIARRSAICQDLLTREPWDLFYTVFGESHGGGHLFWHLSQPEHPLYEFFRSKIDHDPLLNTYQAIDKAIGEILKVAPPHANIVLFSAHGMGTAQIDLPSFVFLPELLYRYSFPGKYALGYSDPSEPIPSMITTMKWNYWERHIWGTKYDSNSFRRFLRNELPSKLFNLFAPWIDPISENDLIFDTSLRKQGETVVPWCPAQWYKPLWSKMKAFAIPSFAEGYVRINLKGREPQGIVEPDEYNTVCDEISELLYSLKDARNGLPMVTRIVRTRENSSDRNPKLPEADLIVVWRDEHMTDVVETPDYGKIGPFPFYRSASHREKGFILACGENIAKGEKLPDHHVLDLPPTILHLMGAIIPEHLEGKSIF